MTDPRGQHDYAVVVVVDVGPHVEIRWPYGRGNALVTPDAVEDWAEGINRLRDENREHEQRAALLRRQIEGLTCERDAIADHAADVTVDAAARGDENERLRGLLDEAIGRLLDFDADAAASLADRAAQP